MSSRLSHRNSQLAKKLGQSILTCFSWGQLFSRQIIRHIQKQITRYDALEPPNKALGATGEPRSLCVIWRYLGETQFLSCRPKLGYGPIASPRRSSNISCQCQQIHNKTWLGYCLWQLTAPRPWPFIWYMYVCAPEMDWFCYDSAVVRRWIFMMFFLVSLCVIHTLNFLVFLAVFN